MLITDHFSNRILYAFVLFIINYRNSKHCLLLLKSIAIGIGVCILYLINELQQVYSFIFYTIVSSIKK